MRAGEPLHRLFGAVCALFGTFFGGFDGLLNALLCFMAADVAAGAALAYLERRLSSRALFRGLCRKCAVLLLVGGAHLLDAYVLGTGALLRTAVIFFYIANEGLSLLENAAALGLPVPKRLRDALETLRAEEPPERRGPAPRDDE